MQKLVQSLQFNIIHAGHAQLDHNWNYSNVISPFARMFMVTKGSAKAYHSKQEFNLQPGYIYYIPSFVYNRYSCEQYHEQYYISFIEEVANGVPLASTNRFKFETASTAIDEYYFKRIIVLNPNRNVVNSDPKAYVHKPTELLQINKENAQRNTNSFMETQGILAILLSRFMTNLNTVTTKENNNEIVKVLAFIANNLHRNLSVSELANYFNLNKDHFSRCFKQKVGETPNRYMNLKRVERAQLLLLTTNDTLAEISDKVGFDNLSYFSKVFKKFTKKTPAAFRNGGMIV